MIDYNRAIGEWLAKERKKQRISQRKMADILGVSKSAIHYWETGKRTIYAQTMMCIFMRFYAHSAFSDNCRILSDFVSVASK